MIYRSIALLHIKKNVTKNAAKQYEILKKDFDLHIIITYSILYHQIFKYSITNYRNLQEYKKTITKDKTKLVELGNLLPELAVIFAFFYRFDTFYQV